MDQRQFNTPEKSETRGFNDLQFRSTVKYVPREHRKLSLKAGIAILIVTIGITYAVMYLIARVLG